MVTVVFGAHGNVGRHVAAGLMAVGEQVRLTSRNPASAGFPAQAEVAPANLDQPGPCPQRWSVPGRSSSTPGPPASRASSGPPGPPGCSTWSCCRRPVVSAGVGRNPVARLHRAVESAVEQSGIDWTFIRPGMAANTQWWWAEPIRRVSAVRLLWPDAQTAPVHEKDVAALAVAGGTATAGRPVYGPQSLTLRQQVRHISDAIGRDISLSVVAAGQAR